MLRLACGIEVAAEIAGTLTGCNQLGIERVVHLSGEHLLAFGQLRMVSHIDVP
jgi:hypothetical protein